MLRVPKTLLKPRWSFTFLAILNVLHLCKIKRENSEHIYTTSTCNSLYFFLSRALMTKLIDIFQYQCYDKYKNFSVYSYSLQTIIFSHVKKIKRLLFYKKFLLTELKKWAPKHQNDKIIVKHSNLFLFLQAQLFWKTETFSWQCGWYTEQL